jgi:broad specificity phosphatase PhoE
VTRPEKDDPFAALSSGSVRAWSALGQELDARRMAPPVVLELLRHGQTESNAAGLISGAADALLTEVGRTQAREVGATLHGRYDAAIHSHLARSRETLRLALSASTAHVGTIIEDNRIAERSMGRLEGTPTRPLPAYDRGDLSWAPAGGEPYLSVTQRILSFLLDVQCVAAQAERELRVLASTHVGPMRIFAGVLLGTSSPIEVLTDQHANAEVWTATFETLEWPPFLSRELMESV